VNAKDENGYTTLHYATGNRKSLDCVKLLVQRGADVNCQDNTDGWTPLMNCVLIGEIATAHYLHEQKADIHYRVSQGINENEDALYWAMRTCAADTTPGIAFAFLSCDTDAKNVYIEMGLTPTIRDAHIETYKHAQAYIDEYHRILNLVLSEHVPVDPRFGLGQMGIYQEPLERTLEYLGLSMSKDQVVNASIDGDTVKRALIPGHLLNANHWYELDRKKAGIKATIKKKQADIKKKEKEHEIEMMKLHAEIDVLSAQLTTQE
jgi:hypothetical protein